MIKNVFSHQVYKVVKSIPFGKVVSYGQVALYIGVPRAARQVGWVLSQSDPGDKIPWWRVVNNKGRVSIKGSYYSAEEQRQLLIQEGIKVNNDLSFEIEKYRFRPDEKFIKSLEADPVTLEILLQEIPFTQEK